MKLTSKAVEVTAQPRAQELVEQSSPVMRHQPKFRYEQFQPNTLIENLSYMLIRPPKCIYDPKDLEVCGGIASNHIHATHKIPFDLSLYLPKRGPPRFVVLYLHCNSSNRIEGYNLVKHLPADVGLACFDFEGCGNRQGKWVTLGVQESKEADVAARWLKQQNYVVVGWGRSMGSVSLLLSQECSVMVADSPFCDLTRLCKESGQYIPYVPYCLFSCIFPCVFCCVSKDIREKTQRNIRQELEVYRVVSEMSPEKSIIFLSGDNDTMIDKQHSQVLFEKFRGHKQLLIFEGTHNSTRSQQTIRRTFDFINDALFRQQVLQLSAAQSRPKADEIKQPMEVTQENLSIQMPQPSSPSNITLSVEAKRKTCSH